MAIMDACKYERIQKNTSVFHNDRCKKISYSQSILLIPAKGPLKTSESK